MHEYGESQAVEGMTIHMHDVVKANSICFTMLREYSWKFISLILLLKIFLLLDFLLSTVLRHV
jgi:hypothetical protein